MAYYVQYDEQGFISGTVSAQTAPEHPRQLVFDAPVDTHLKKVNLQTMQFEQLPPYVPTAEELQEKIDALLAKKAELEA